MLTPQQKQYTRGFLLPLLDSLVSTMSPEQLLSSTRITKLDEAQTKQPLNDSLFGHKMSMIKIPFNLRQTLSEICDSESPTPSHDIKYALASLFDFELSLSSLLQENRFALLAIRALFVGFTFSRQHELTYNKNVLFIMDTNFLLRLNKFPNNKASLADLQEFILYSIHETANELYRSSAQKRLQKQKDAALAYQYNQLSFQREKIIATHGVLEAQQHVVTTYAATRPADSVELKQQMALFANNRTVLTDTSEQLQLDFQCTLQNLISIRQRDGIFIRVNRHDNQDASSGLPPAKQFLSTSIPNQHLANAVKSSDLEKMSYWLEMGAEVNATGKDVRGIPALHWAIRKSFLPGVQLLISHSADCKLADQYGTGTLQAALLFQEDYKQEIVDLLFAEQLALTDPFQLVLNNDLSALKTRHGNSIDLSVLDSLGFSMLAYAAGLGRNDIVSFLLSQAPSLLDRPHPISGLTPTMIAAFNGQTLIVDLLIQAGAKLLAKNRDGNSAFLMAAHNGRIETMRLLLARGAAIGEKNHTGNSAILWSAKHGYEPAVRWLVTQEANPLDRDLCENTPVMLAAAGGYLLVVKFFVLECHINLLSYKNQARLSAIQIAAENGRTNILSWAKGQGCTLSEKTPEGLTLLLLAVANGHLETAWWLINNGASIDETDCFGNDLFLIAAKNGHTHILEKFSQFQNPNESHNNFENNALLWSAYGGFLLTIQWLKQSGARLDTYNDEADLFIHLAALKGHLVILRWANDEGCHLDIVNVHGNTPLSNACQNGHIEIACFLIAEGTPINHRNLRGETPFIIAAENNQLELTTKLKKLGADMRLRDNHGNSALLMAARFGANDSIRWLIENGISAINEENDRGMTAILCAAFNGHTQTVELLLTLKAQTTERNKDGQSGADLANIIGRQDLARVFLR